MPHDLATKFLRTFYNFFSKLVRTPVHKLLFLFYLLILFSLKDYIFTFIKIVYVALFLKGPIPQTLTVQRELLQVQLVFKHGHRSPFRLYKTDPNPKELWPEGLGQVSQLGRLQLFIMGKHLKEKYKDFITSNPNEVMVQSSDALRCMYSAYCLLAGMYPPNEEWEFVSNFPWQPIFVSYVPEAEEMYLQSNPNCKKYEACKNRVKKSTEVTDFNAKNKPFFEFWHDHAQKTILNYDNAADLYKTLSVEIDNNYTIPDWAHLYMDELIEMTDMGYLNHFKTKLQQRLRGGPILGLIFERMKEKVENGNHPIKVYGYSGHGSNIAAIQCALLSYDMKHAPHAAILLFELYREATGEHTVRFIYYNSTHPETIVEEPFIFRLPGCSEYCPIGFVDDFLKDLVPEDWENECKEDDDEEHDFVPPQIPDYFRERGGHSSALKMPGLNFSMCFILLIFIKLLYSL